MVACSGDSIDQQLTFVYFFQVMGGGLAGRKSLGRLAVMTDLEIRSMAVQRCDRATHCADCVALQDPYCAWDKRASRCSSGDWTSNMANSFLQSVGTGKHSLCPLMGLSNAGAKNEATEDVAEKQGAFLYSYGFEHAPLGQVVNIVDNQNNLEKHSRTFEESGKTAAPGSNDNSVQVNIIDFVNYYV